MKRGREGVEAQQRRLCVCWSGAEKEREGGVCSKRSGKQREVCDVKWVSWGEATTNVMNGLADRRRARKVEM